MDYRSIAEKSHGKIPAFHCLQVTSLVVARIYKGGLGRKQNPFDDEHVIANMYKLLKYETEKELVKECNDKMGTENVYKIYLEQWEKLWL